MLYYWFVSRHLYNYNFVSILFKPLVAVVGMAGFIFYTGFGLIVTIIGGGVVYLGLIFILRTFRRGELKFEL